MRIRSLALNKLAALAASAAVQSWMSTLDYQVIYYDPATDPVKREYCGQKIYVFWHEYMLAPIYMRGHCNMAMLISQHRDAELLLHAGRYLGFDVVRGSTTRGGVAALRELTEKSQRMNLAITPDGPRGPRRCLASGAVYLSSRLGIPLVAMGLGLENSWRLGSWDRFAIPKPYSRARGIISPALHIPPALDRDGVEHYRSEVERWLNRMTAEAEHWAASGTRRTLQEKAYREPFRAWWHRDDVQHRIDPPQQLPGSSRITDFHAAVRQ